MSDSDNDALKPFRSSEGVSTPEGQQKAGEWEGQHYQSPTPQQSWESPSDYFDRVDAFNGKK